MARHTAHARIALRRVDLALDLEVVDREHAERIAGLAQRLRALIFALLR
jgi:hypothetical protein